MKKLFFLFAVALSGVVAFAQSAEEVSALLESEEITKGQAAYFACVYQNIAEEGVTEDGAFLVCKAQNLFKDGESADDAISLSQTCFVIARVSEMRGGVFYSLSHSARYAFREFKALGIVPPNAAPQQTVSGGEFLALLNGFEQKGKTKIAAAARSTAEVAHMDDGKSLQKIQDEATDGREDMSAEQNKNGSMGGEDAAAKQNEKAPFLFDFGGIVTNDSSFKNHGDESPKFDQQNSISLWTLVSFDKSGENYFAAEAGYRFEGDFEKDDNKFTNAFDINLLEVAFTKNFSSSKINLEAGRFYFSDMSGTIFTQNSDGVKFDFQNNLLKVSAYVSCTGLLNAHNTSIITATPAQFVMRGTPPVAQMSSADKNKVYDLAENYLVADASLSFPYLFANQTVALELLGAFRLEDEGYNRMYITAGINGPIWRSLFYNASTTVGIANYENANGDRDTGTSNLTHVGVNYYFNKFSVGASGVYASGQQGKFLIFTGVTKNTSTYAYSDFLYSGIMKFGANGTFKPIENLLLSVGFDIVLNAAAGDNFDKIEYYGFQYAVSATWQIKSDFQIGASLRQFIDKDDSTNVKKLAFGVSAALAF